MENDLLDHNATWFLVPMLNPTGFRLDQRENKNGVDLNRDYLGAQSTEIRDHVRWLKRQPRFDLAICLHEDWEATGFYLYELSRGPDRTQAIAMRTVAASYLPIDSGDVIDGRPVDELGIIRPEADPALRETWPEAIYLFKHHTDICFTLETPSSFSPDLRIQAHTSAVLCAVKHLREQSPPA